MTDEPMVKIAAFHVNPDDPHVRRFGAHSHLMMLAGRRYGQNHILYIDEGTVRPGDYGTREHGFDSDPVIIAASSDVFWSLARLVQAAADDERVISSTTNSGAVRVEPVGDSAPSSQLSVQLDPDGTIVFSGSPGCLGDLAQNLAFAGSNEGHVHLDTSLGPYASLAPGSPELILEPRAAPKRQDGKQ